MVVNRAAPATIGQLRMLHEFGWMRYVRYISAISGGAWASIPYTYLPNEMDTCRFLGEYIPPDKMGAYLENPEKSMAFSKGSMLNTIADSSITARYL